jgi:hypothetical protein
MKTLIVTSLALLLCGSLVYAQSDHPNVYWRLDPSVSTCSMIIDPSLTQAQWHEFTKQVGALSSFKSLAPAQTLGRFNFRVGVDYESTPVDQHSLAWINTFVHPDEECPLGDKIAMPTLRASVGVSDNMDIGGYWTTAPGANYGLIGGEFKYAFLQEEESLPAAAVRASFTLLTGVPDFDLSIYSIDLLASKTIAALTPYVGARTSLAVGTETSSNVSLKTERIPIAQGYLGIAYSLWVLNVAAEYNVSTVNTLAFAVAVKF